MQMKINPQTPSRNESYPLDVLKDNKALRGTTIDCMVTRKMKKWTVKELMGTDTLLTCSDPQSFCPFSTVSSSGMCRPF